MRELEYAATSSTAVGIRFARSGLRDGPGPSTCGTHVYLTSVAPTVSTLGKYSDLVACNLVLSGLLGRSVDDTRRHPAQGSMWLASHDVRDTARKTSDVWRLRSALQLSAIGPSLSLGLSLGRSVTIYPRHW